MIITTGITDIQTRQDPNTGMYETSIGKLILMYSMLPVRVESHSVREALPVGEEFADFNKAAEEALIKHHHVPSDAVRTLDDEVDEYFSTQYLRFDWVTVDIPENM